MMWMPFMSISQSLTPQIHYSKTDTLFCFTISQSKLIAKYLEEGKYNRLALKSTNHQNTKLKRLIGVQDSIISTQYQMLQVQDSILNNHQEQLLLAVAQSNQIKKELKKKKRQNILLTAGIVVVSILAIAK